MSRARSEKRRSHPSTSGPMYESSRVKPSSTHAKLGSVLTGRRSSAPELHRKRKPSSRPLEPLEHRPQPRLGKTPTDSRSVTSALGKVKSLSAEERAAFLASEPGSKTEVERFQLSSDSGDDAAATSYCLDRFLGNDNNAQPLARGQSDSSMATTIAPSNSSDSVGPETSSGRLCPRQQ